MDATVKLETAGLGNSYQLDNLGDHRYLGSAMSSCRIFHFHISHIFSVGFVWKCGHCVGTGRYLKLSLRFLGTILMMLSTHMVIGNDHDPIYRNGIWYIPTSI
ncbi:hypothetical protein F4811DRAFT_533622, partial [Daldinia bambusicola]